MKIDKNWVVRHISDYGMLIVLVLLCVFFSLATRKPQPTEGPVGGETLGAQIIETYGEGISVFVASTTRREDGGFAAGLESALAGRAKIVAVVEGQASEAKGKLRELAEAGTRVDVIARSGGALAWGVFENLSAEFPELGTPVLEQPEGRMVSHFAKRDNLMNIAGQIPIIAVLAIGMTFVIITAGIDLSVGSLIAVSAVTAAWLVRAWGGVDASMELVLVAWALAILVSAAIGLMTGSLITFCNMPPFIVTLALMLILRGVAKLVTGGETINDVPANYTWLGSDSISGIPIAAVLMGVLYLCAHLVLSKTKFGRYVYAIGGNREAARLSGVPIRRVLILVYAGCGALAGLGGVMMSSRLSSGGHRFGEFDELTVIAAVVVGGASLLGGEGKMLSTLIGAFIIAVVKNGMNQLGLADGWQAIVLGAVILIAVLMDQAKRWWVASLSTAS